MSSRPRPTTLTAKKTHKPAAILKWEGNINSLLHRSLLRLCTTYVDLQILGNRYRSATVIVRRNSRRSSQMKGIIRSFNKQVDMTILRIIRTVICSQTKSCRRLREINKLNGITVYLYILKIKTPVQ